jgi:hypothetical protein
MILFMNKMNSVKRFIQVKNERFGNKKLLFTAARKLHQPLGLQCNEQEARIVHYVEIDLMGCQKNLKMQEYKEKLFLLVLNFCHG